MHSCIFDHQSTCRSGNLHYLVLSLSARQLLLQYSLYPPTVVAGIFPSGLSWFKRCIPNTLALWQKLENSAPLLRFHLSIFDVLHFRRRLWSCQQNFSCYPLRTRCWWFSHSWSTNYSGGIRYFSRVAFPSTLLWRVSLGSPCPKRFPVFSGIQNYWKDCFTPASNVLGSLLPAFLFSSFSDEEGILGSLPWYKIGLLWWPYLLFIM